jgi:hypothetical protein
LRKRQTLPDAMKMASRTRKMSSGATGDHTIAAMNDKNCYPKQEPIPCHLLSRQMCFFAFKTSGIDLISLAFKASFMSTAPLVLHYTITASRIWTVSLIGISSLYLSKDSTFTNERNTLKFHV